MVSRRQLLRKEMTREMLTLLLALMALLPGEEFRLRIGGSTQEEMKDSTQDQDGHQPPPRCRVSLKGPGSEGLVMAAHQL